MLLKTSPADARARLPYTPRRDVRRDELPPLKSKYDFTAFLKTTIKMSKIGTHFFKKHSASTTRLLMSDGDRETPNRKTH